jgi:outer membrane lipoprotein-sorting protein
MNCAECRDNLVACLEGLLDTEQARQCRAHLETCAACRAECASVTGLQQRLAASGRVAAEVSLVEPVMRRVRQQQLGPERNTLMNLLFRNRWGFGLGAAAGAAALVLIVFLVSPRTQASAAEVLARGAKAVSKLSSIHLRGQLRTAPQDNFSYINPDLDFVTVELWKQFEPELKWRVEKPARVAVMDGQSTLLFIRTANLAMRVPRPSQSAFDTEWLHEMADPSETLTNELTAIKAHGWPVTLKREQGADGNPKSVITIEAKSGLPDSDYLKNKFFMTADTRRVYVFDDQTKLLESVRIYLHATSGEVLIFELQQIDYNRPIDPAVFQFELPKNVNWYQLEMQKLPDNEKYASMTAAQAARAYFEAFGRGDWTEAEKFRRSPVDEATKQTVSGLEIVSLGQSFTSAASPEAQFVPYEIKLEGGRVIKHNLALKKDPATGRWFVDGGGF